MQSLDHEVSKPEQWPKSMDDAEALRSRLEAVLDELPIWAEQDNAPLLNRINWAVEVLWKLCRDDAPAPENLAAIADEYRALLDAASDDSRLDPLKKALRAALESTEAAERDHVVDAARQLVDKPHPSEPESEAVSAMETLARWSPDTQIDQLREQLRTRLLYSEAIQQAELLRRQFSRVRATQSLAVKRAGLSRLYSII